MEVAFDTHLKSIWHKLRSFPSKSELHVEEIFHESLSMFASHIIAIDRKNVIPEGEKSRLSGGLATHLIWQGGMKILRGRGALKIFRHSKGGLWKFVYFKINEVGLQKFQASSINIFILLNELFPSLIRRTSPLKPALFNGKSDESQWNKSSSNLLVNYNRGNSMIISDCQVSFVSNSDFTLRLRIVVKWLVLKQFCVESPGHHLRWQTDSQAAIVGFYLSNLFTWHPVQKKKCKSWLCIITCKKHLGRGNFVLFSNLFHHFREHSIVSKFKQDSCHEVHASLYI